MQLLKNTLQFLGFAAGYFLLFFTLGLVATGILIFLSKLLSALAL